MLKGKKKIFCYLRQKFDYSLNFCEKHDNKRNFKRTKKHEHYLGYSLNNLAKNKKDLPPNRDKSF